MIKTKLICCKVQNNTMCENAQNIALSGGTWVMFRINQIRQKSIKFPFLKDLSSFISSDRHAEHAIMVKNTIIATFHLL